MKWQKGQSGNPGGRPKRNETLTNILDELGNERPDMDNETRKRLLAHRLWELALTGDLAAMKYVYDRLDGTPTQSIAHQHSAPDDRSITVQFVKAGENDDTG